MARDTRANCYSSETRTRAVRMVLDNQGHYASASASIKAIAPKIGCGWDTLRCWVQHQETDTGHRDGVTSEERARTMELEREVRDLRQANEILKKANACFAHEAPLRHRFQAGAEDLDRPLKR